MNNLEQAMDLLKKYKQEGGDMNAATQAYNTLNSAGKTSLGLNQWQHNDKPCMEDFNSDNRRIDELLSNKVNKEPPVQIPLPLGENFTGSNSSYWKTQEGIVYIFLSGRKTDSSAFIVGDIVATLPIGFRPISTIYRAIVADTYPSGARQIANITITTDGKIYVDRNMNSDMAKFQAINGENISFVAAQ